MENSETFKSQLNIPRSSLHHFHAKLPRNKGHMNFFNQRRQIKNMKTLNKG